MQISFFTDHNVPESVVKVLTANGHEVTRLRDVLSERSADEIVAITCMAAGQILITHDTDFKGMARRLNLTQRHARFNLHRIDLRCIETESAKRIQDLLPVILDHWQYTLSHGSVFVVEIRTHCVLIHR